MASFAKSKFFSLDDEEQNIKIQVHKDTNVGIELQSEEHAIFYG